MKIRFFGYNASLIESDYKKIVIDPGGLFFYWFRFDSLIPRSEWSGITHILITHGDSDHYRPADRTGLDCAILAIGESFEPADA